MTHISWTTCGPSVKVGHVVHGAIPASATTTTTAAPSLRLEPNELVRPVVEDPSDADWEHFSEAIAGTCEEIGSADVIAYTGFGDLWLRFNEQWATYSSGIEFTPYAEVTDEHGVRRSQSDAPEWMKSTSARASVVFRCFEEVHDVDEFGHPTDIEEPQRVVPRGEIRTHDFE